MRGLTKKLDYEKAGRQARIHNEDYRDRLQEEGDDFDRGGKKKREFFVLSRSKLYVDLRGVFQDDKLSLIATLERHWKFIIGGETGTVSQLLKNPKVGKQVKERFEIMKKSILRSEEIIGVAEHPKTKNQYHLVEFLCNIQPQEPFPNPVFKKHLAFAVKIEGLP